ncbi:hypothetical protein Tco_1469756 [Tanacetum coccineum]
MEAMKFGVPIIAMPMHLDQPVNARLVVEIGMGKEVIRDNEGVLMGAKVAEVVNEVVTSNQGKNIRDKAKKISDDLETKGDEEIEFVADELLQLCQKGHKLRRVGAPLQKAKSDGFMIHSFFTGYSRYSGSCGSSDNCLQFKLAAGAAPLSGGPIASPLNLFPQEIPSGAAGGNLGSLDFLRNN